jgi:hypothetical protein
VKTENNFGVIKRHEIPGIAESLLASQRGHWPVELFNQVVSDLVKCLDKDGGTDFKFHLFFTCPVIQWDI